MTFSLSIVFALAAVAAPITAQEGSTQWDRYVPGRLQTVIDAHAAVIAEASGEDSVLAISAKDFPTRLPVHDGMAEWAEANLKPGDVTTVFVMFLGARRIHGEAEWMFFATGI